MSRGGALAITQGRTLASAALSSSLNSVEKDGTVPGRFRGLIEEAIRLVCDGSPEVLASNDRISFRGDDPLLWIREAGFELVPLVPKAWESSDAGPVDRQPGVWWVVVDLWDARGRTDYSLEATVRETPDGYLLAVDNIHIM